tara:strand:- start:103 stop:471 length:369 start_codon:yes stop_codon:yes gene_type:complete
MDFATSINTCLVRKFADFTGRASRSEFWFFQLFLFLAGFIAGIIDMMILNYHPDDLGPMTIILYVIIIIPAIAVTARRLHDVNQSGWWQLIVFTIIGIPVLLYWYIIKGTDENNEYGKDTLS